MRLAVVFTVLTWLVLPSVSIAQNNYAEQSRVKGGGADRARAEAWMSDKKLYKGSLTKSQLNQVPGPGSILSLPTINGYVETVTHRFEVIELVDDETTLLLLDKERFLLLGYKNRKLEVGEKVRLVPAVQLLESQDLRGSMVPVIQLATAKDLADYRKKMQSKQKKK
jgi:hypothetical protein